MSVQSWFIRLGNTIFAALLRSPLHSLMDTGTLLISVTGRRSGRIYTTPVNYLPDGGQLIIISLRDRTWWRNLRDGAEVGLYLRGAPRRGMAWLMQDGVSVTAALGVYLRRVPSYARMLGVRRRPDGEPEPKDLARVAHSRVVVNVQLI